MFEGFMNPSASRSISNRRFLLQDRCIEESDDHCAVHEGLWAAGKNANSSVYTNISLNDFQLCSICGNGNKIIRNMLPEIFS